MQLVGNHSGLYPHLEIRECTCCDARRDHSRMKAWSHPTLASHCSAPPAIRLWDTEKSPGNTSGLWIGWTAFLTDTIFFFLECQKILTSSDLASISYYLKTSQATCLSPWLMVRGADNLLPKLCYTVWWRKIDVIHFGSGTHFHITLVLCLFPFIYFKVLVQDPMRSQYTLKHSFHINHIRRTKYLVLMLARSLHQTWTSRERMHRTRL